MKILTKEQLKVLIKNNIGKSYTYILHREDSTPFYVGVGKNGRVFQHETPSSLKTETNGLKRKTITDELRNYGKLRYSIILFHTDRLECLKHEFDAIKKFGRIQLGGILTNWTDGGEIGPNGYIYSEERRTQQTIINRNNASKISEGVKQFYEKFPEELERLRSHLNVVRHNAKSRDKISKASSERWADPDYKRRLSETQKISQKKISDIHKENMKLKWADPEFREKMLEARRLARLKRKQENPA